MRIGSKRHASVALYSRTMLCLEEKYLIMHEAHPLVLSLSTENLEVIHHSGFAIRIRQNSRNVCVVTKSVVQIEPRRTFFGFTQLMVMLGESRSKGIQAPDGTTCDSEKQP